MIDSIKSALSSLSDLELNRLMQRLNHALASHEPWVQEGNELKANQSSIFSDSERSKESITIIQQIKGAVDNEKARRARAPIDTHITEEWNYWTNMIQNRGM